MDHIITCKGICRDFKSGREVIHAVKNVSIAIPTGKLTILRGRSGSGKTTLLNILGALDEPTAGEVTFLGKKITQISQDQKDSIRRKEMGFVFQSVALISLMTAYENVEFALRVASFDPKQRKERAEECLNMVGLGKRMKHRPFELSGGEQQRVAIARAIAHKPKILFADEPTGELDTKMAIQVMALFKMLVEKEGITILMTTHDPSMMELADHVFTMEDGEIIDEQ